MTSVKFTLGKITCPNWTLCKIWDESVLRSSSTSTKLLSYFSSRMDERAWVGVRISSYLRHQFRTRKSWREYLYSRGTSWSRRENNGPRSSIDGFGIHCITEYSNRSGWQFGIRWKTQLSTNLLTDIALFTFAKFFKSLRSSKSRIVEAQELR